MLVLRYSRHHSADDIYYGVIVVVLLFLTDIVQNVLFVTVFTITHVAGRWVGVVTWGGGMVGWWGGWVVGWLDGGAVGRGW